MNTVLHTHWESRFDAVPRTADMVSRLQEIGAKAVAITDHGSVAAMEDAYDAVKDAGADIKLIYGMEAYLETDIGLAHLIVMAKDKDGKRAVDKLVYQSNQNIKISKGGEFPVATKEMLKGLFGEGKCGHGHAVFTTACISGPAGLILQVNRRIANRINKIASKMQTGLENGNMLRPDDARLAELVSKRQALLEKNKEISLSRNELNKTARKKTDGLIKREKKYREAGEDGKADKLAAEIEGIISAAQKAQEEIVKLTTTAEANRRLSSELNEKIKKMTVAVEKYQKADGELAELKKLIQPEYVLREQAKEQIKWLADTLGNENLFVEVQNHGFMEEAEVYPVLAEIAKELGLPLVAANDAHMANNSEHDLNARLVARYLRFSKIDPDEQIELEKEMYLKNRDELRTALLKILPAADVEEALNNADLIGDICEGYERDKESHYPVFNKNVDAKVKLRQLAYEGIEWRFPKKAGWTQEYQERLEYELKVICQMGYADYHLIIKEILEYARLLGRVPKERVSEAPLDIRELERWVNENGWDVGIGIGFARGSAAGSLVCYLTGITGLDPIKYGLVFERFLNPERVSMPDIDSDFRIAIRDKAIEFITNKYGEKAVCNIMTKGYQAVKGAIRDAARFYGTRTEGDFLGLGIKLRKAVPNYLNISFSTSMQEIDKKNQDETLYEYMAGLFCDNQDALNILKIAVDVEKSFTSYGMHAAGLIIGDSDDLTDYIPLKYNTSTERWTTQCDMVQSEALGLLKMDLLNLKNLDIITDTVMMIKKNHGISIDLICIPFEPEVFSKIYAAGNTIGVFQFESPGMRSYLKKMQPRNINDVIILNAMYRPGPMRFIEGVCNVKNGKCVARYATPELETILKETYGAIVYQEQVMEICRKLAGYSMGQADNIRRAMSKKKQYVIDAERQNFVYGNKEQNIRGCIANGITEKAANKIYDSMVDFAKYAFNKSHAAAYSVLSYITAYLKYHYTAEYMCSLLNHTDKISEYPKMINNVREMGIEVLPPDINRSEVGFSVQEGRIYFGLNSIKGVGEVVQGIINERKNGSFRSFADYIKRIHQKKSTEQNMIKAGVFDSLGLSRLSLQGAAYTEMASLAENARKKEKEAHELRSVIEILKREQFGSVEALKNCLQESGIGYSVTTKRVPTIENIEKKLVSAETAAASSMKELDRIQIPYIKPDIMAELEEEKEVLGMYISGHPIDQYCVTSTPIADVSEQTGRITGIIESITLRYNKRKECWAGICVSDQTGSIMVNVFARQFMEFEKHIQKGQGIIIEGRVEVDAFRSTDEDTVYCMTAGKILPARRKEKKYRLTLYNEAEYFFGMKDELKQCETACGVILELYFVQNALFRRLNYSIPENVAVQIGAEYIAG